MIYLFKRQISPPPKKQRGLRILYKEEIFRMRNSIYPFNIVQSSRGVCQNVSK